MAKRFSAPLERTARLLDLVPYINTHQGISIKELSGVFKVSSTQMVSDLTTLWMCGLPGYTPLELMDLDFESGFVTINNAPTLSKPRSISFDEGVALLLGLDLLRSSISSDRRDLIERIDSLSERLSTLIKLPSALSATAPVNEQISRAVLKSIKSQTGLQIVYHSLYRDEITTREIFPIEIIDNHSQQYLSAYCYTAQDFRQFKLDRVQSAQIINIEKTVPATSIDSKKIPFIVSVIKPTREIAERFNQPRLKPTTNFESASYSKQWIERSILASGSAVALQSPPEIRISVAEMAQSMLDRYKAG
ncbi:MAG: WYL domain-containing protein [Candidatus Planktophila sp.]|nr:WYL domain-containing protein [Candidatus Planktophila sp.]